MALRYDAGEVITAMVTPFNAKREIDYDKVESLTKYLISHGSDAILVGGTTGEGPTLSHEEDLELLSTVRRASENKVKVIMNAGSNSTETAVRTAKLAEKEDVDALLSVAPYYNKPNQKGLIAHFSEIAECTATPATNNTTTPPTITQRFFPVNLFRKLLFFFIFYPPNYFPRSIVFFTIYH